MPANAARHYIAAGDRAGRRYGLHEAIAHYERARSLLDGLPGGRERDLLAMRAALRVGWRLFQREGSPDAALPPMENARELAARVDDKASLAEAVVRLGFLCMVRGDMRNASEHARTAAPLLEHVKDGALRVFARALEATTVLVCGDLQEACRLFGALGVFGLAKERGTPETDGPSKLAMAQGALALWLTGKPDDAIALARKGYQAAEALNDPWDRAALLGDLATMHAWRREPAKAEELAKRSLALAAPGAFGLWKNRADLVLRWAEAELAPEVSEARANELLSKPWESVAFGRSMPSVLYATMCTRLGRTDRALDVIAEALAWVERSGERWLEPELHRLRGEILQSTDAREAERSFVAAIEIAREQSSTSLELRATLSLHALVSGAKKKQARDEVARVLSLITGGQDTPDVVDARRVVDG
jgi:tetratricopeptide (TPR) repeat protein